MITCTSGNVGWVCSDISELLRLKLLRLWIVGKSMRSDLKLSLSPSTSGMQSRSRDICGKSSLMEKVMEKRGRGIKGNKS